MASDQRAISAVAPWAGVEPATFRLTVERSTAELPGNAATIDSGRAITKAYRRCQASRLKGGPPKRRRHEGWRPRPELNRGARICSPDRRHLSEVPRVD